MVPLPVAQKNSTVAVLNRLLGIVTSSFPMYLVYAHPVLRRGDEPAQDALEHVVADQRELAGRIYSAIEAAGGTPGSPEFPAEFTGTHDLELSYVLRLAIEYQKHDIADIESCVSALEGSPQAQELAQEALGAAKGHSQTLEEIA